MIVRTTAAALVAAGMALGYAGLSLADPPIGADSMQNRVVRSSQIIGVQVWDAQNQQLGTIKDVVIDYQESCPAVFVAMSSDIAGMEGFVMVPFDASRLQFDNRANRTFLVINIGMDQFRRAPRITGDNWERLHDQQFLTQTRQFYRDVQRSAARPGAGGNGETGRRSNTGRREDMDRRPNPNPPAPGNRNDSGTGRGTDRGGNPQGERGNRGKEPNRPGSTPGTGEGTGVPERGPDNR